MSWGQYASDPACVRGCDTSDLTPMMRPKPSSWPGCQARDRVCLSSWFKPWFRLVNAQTTWKGGKGLGRTVAREEAHQEMA